MVGRWTLAELARADVQSPAVIVIGAVAAFQFLTLSPFGDRVDRDGRLNGCRNFPPPVLSPLRIIGLTKT